MNFIKEYLSQLSSAVDDCGDDILKVINILKMTVSSGKRIWILGNGGSLTVAQHFAQDLVKMHGIKAHCLNDPSFLTAYSNDDGFEHCLFRPFRILKDSGDAVIIFSCSGKSNNYIEFIKNEINPLVSIVGTDGGFLKSSSDVCVHVKSMNYPICETAFSLIADLISQGLEKKEIEI